MSFRILKALSSQLFVCILLWKYSRNQSTNMMTSLWQWWWYVRLLVSRIRQVWHRITAFVVAVMVLFLFMLSSYSRQWFYHQNHQRHAIVIRIPTKIRGFSIKWFRSQKLCQIFNTVEVSEATEWVTDGIYMADAHRGTTAQWRFRYD